MKIKALGVKNYGSFNRQTVFEFKDGLNVIYGLNRTSGRNSKNSNWVGKSLFFNSLSELLFDQPIVGLKGDKVKSGSRTVLLEKDGKLIQIIRQSGKRESLSIKVDGKEIEHLTKTKAQDWITQQIGITKSEFESLMHLDSRIPHPLVMGTSTERKHFFDQFFHLEQIDYERRLYLKKLRQLKEQKTAYAELRTSYLALKKQVVGRREIDSIKDELAQLIEERNRLAEQSNEYQQYKSLAVVYQTLESKIKELPCELDDLDAYIESAKKELAKFESFEDSAMEYAVYLEQLQRYNTVLASVSEFARSVDSAKAEEGANRYRRYKDQLDDLDELDCPQKPEEVDAVDFDLAELSVRIKDTQHRLDHARKFKEGICPTCGQPVKVNAKALQAELKELKQQYEAASAYADYQQELSKYESAKAKYDEQIELKQTLSQKVKKFERYYKAWLELRKIPSKPESVEKPKYDADECRKRINKLNKSIDSMQSIARQSKALKQYLNWSGCTEFDYEHFNEVQSQVSKLEAKIEYAEQSGKQLDSIRTRLLELKKELADYPIVEELANIFSDNVMKKAMVQQISVKLCELLNYYASLVFEQPYTFSLVWDSQIQLICERRVGKQSLVSDVRKLSGAESKLFTVILVLSLLSFIPMEKRPSLMLLDEPTANMSAETTQAFMKLLVMLQKVVPCIVVITPRNDVYPESRPFTVVRDQSGSRIEAGLPDEIK